MVQNALHRLAGLHHWQIDGLAIALLLQGVFLALVPEEGIMLALGVLWGRHQIGFLEAMLTVQLGLLPANSFSTFLGDRLGIRIFEVRPFKWFLSRKSVNWASRHLRNHGAWVTFLVRFIPSIRGPVYVAIGMSKFGVFRFFRIDALASLIHVPLLLCAGRFLGKKMGWS